MKKTIALYNVLLLLWFVLLTLIWWSTFDLFQPGKSRIFSSLANATAIGIILVLFRHLVKSKARKLIVLSSVIWITIIMLFYYQVFMALIMEPPYGYIETKARASGMTEGTIFKTINGPSGSAVGEYQRWMYGWRVAGECIFDCS